MKRAAVAALCVAACAHARLPASAVDGASSYVAPRAFVASPAADGWTRELRVAAGAPGASWVVDAALMEAAQAVAERIAVDPAHRAPSARAVQALAWRAGLADPVPTVVTVHRSAGAPLGDDTTRGLQEIAAQDHPTHLGVAEASRGADRFFVALLSRRRLRLTPVPRSAHRGARLALEGSLEPGLHAPVLSITHPEGRVEELPLGDGPDFLGRVPLDAAGTWQVEVEASGAEGSTVLANFPVYVDATPPPVPPPGAVEAQAADATAVEASLLALLNEARARAGAPPLQALAALGDAARAHSRDMAEHHFVAHTSPTHGTVADRLVAAGLRSGLTLENVARGYGAQEIHEGFLASPGHRANLLNAEVTHVGIGVVADPAGGGLLVTQDFVTVASTIDTGAAARSLLRAVNIARQGRGLVALEERATLSDAARAAAEAYFHEPLHTQEEALRDVTGRLQREGLLFRRLSVAAAFGPRIDGAERLEPLLDESSRAVGVGVAQGNRPDAPPNSVFVVYVLAVPR